MKRHKPLSAEYIRSILRVNLSTGKCVWIAPTKYHPRMLGKEAGFARTTHSKNYWVIKIGGIPYLRSQIIFTVKHGFWPHPCIDHRNGSSLDDRWRNLRVATYLQNCQNRKPSKGRKLPMGVKKTAGGFQARIRANGNLLHLGVFTTANAAESVYKKARIKYFGEWA